MRRAHCAFRRLKRNESRDMYNVYSPGHGQSPLSVSFLWHDPSWMPLLSWSRIQLSNTRAEGLHRFTFLHPHLRFPSLLFLLPCTFFQTNSLSRTLSCSSLSLYFDLACVGHSCISPFMHALSQGFNIGSTGGVVSICKHIVFHKTSQEAKRVKPRISPLGIQGKRITSPDMNSFSLRIRG